MILGAVSMQTNVGVLLGVCMIIECDNLIYFQLITF